MSELENNSNDEEKVTEDFFKINDLINCLDLCTSSSQQGSNAFEINTILNALEEYLDSLDVQNRLKSNKEIIQEKLPNIFYHFCQISIRFSASLSDYPLFVNALIGMWNLICTELNQSLEKDLLSVKEYYTMAVNGLNTSEFSMYLLGEDVNVTIKGYVRIFLRLAKTVIWSDARRMENLNLSDYTSYKCLHDNKYDNVFHKIITFIDYWFTQAEYDRGRDECVKLIFSLLVSMSDSKNFLLITMRTGFPAKIVEWLNLISKRTMSFYPLESLIISLSNISQSEEGIIALNKADAISVLRASEKTLADKLQRSPFILSFYPRIYAMLATTDQLKTLPILEPAIDFLLKGIHEANKSANLRASNCHLYEYLVPLAKLLVNDHVANYLLNNLEFGGLPYFIELFHKHNILSSDDLFVKHLIRLALYNILCSLTFHPSVQQELNENQIFLRAVMETSNSSISNNETVIPSSLRNNLMTVKTAADGILVYLDKFKAPISSHSQTINKSTPKIPMISYSHTDATFCRSVVAHLKEHSISVWIDEDGHCLTDDCWEEIAIAIRNASVVLIVVSDNYCSKSDSCRVEATYAIKLKIPIIALYIDEKYHAEPWLDIHLAGLHVKFGQKPFPERISRLAKYITARKDTLETTDTWQSPLVVNSSHEVNIEPIEKPKFVSIKSEISEAVINHSMPRTVPRTWSAVEVKSWWCTEKGLIPQLCTFSDGKALCVYARLYLGSYQENPLKHFQDLATRLKQQHGIDFYDDHYANLASAMIWIEEQDETPDRTVKNQQQSVSCTLL